jgi:hypothetical protein
MSNFFICQFFRKSNFSYVKFFISQIFHKSNCSYVNSGRHWQEYSRRLPKFSSTPVSSNGSTLDDIGRSTPDDTGRSTPDDCPLGGTPDDIDSSTPDDCAGSAVLQCPRMTVLQTILAGVLQRYWPRYSRRY